MTLSIRLLIAATLAAAVITAAGAPAAHAQSGLCTPPVANKVACENTLDGADPSTWQIDGPGDDSIQGFATQMSVRPGDSISFKIKSSTPNFTIDILRLGYYGGDGARRMATGLTPTGPSTQPTCREFADSGLIDCGNWAVSRTWTVPATAVSGVYIAHLKRNDGQGDSHIVFVVRDDASRSDIVVQTSDTTWQAYNAYGGNSTYTCDSSCPPGNPRAYKSALKVSYNRPLRTERDSPGSALFRGAEYSMIRFLERNGYDVSYISGLDTHRRGSLLLNHRIFITSGHDEYWSAEQRANVEAARDAGVNMAFFAGNEVFWKHRLEPSADGSTQHDRTLVVYKDTHFDDPAFHDPVGWTGTWRDPRFADPADGVKPENAITGQSFVVNSGTSDIMVPAAYGKLRLWRNTAAATLSSGQSLRLAPSTLGYEWDEDVDNGFRPAGQWKLSSTTVSGLEMFLDYGSTVTQTGTATHNLVMYRAASGALVFGAGTVQWAWGLDSWNGTESPPDRNMQQATVNLFADMGVQPATREPGLVAATKSTDTGKPTSAITSPPTTVADGARVTITGTASDTGGGVVAGVEVSTDDGQTWHPATSGTTSWTYSWIAKGAPSTKIRTRASDDSGNLETPGAGVTVAVTCPCTMWGANVAPQQADAGDASPIELGVKFRTDTFGTITGVRFFKSAANTGAHVGSLWSADGERLAQATFQNETASGWQTVTFDTPVSVLPGQTYVASYHAPNGHYAATQDYFWRQPSPGPNGGALLDTRPVRALRNAGGTTNGVFAYSPSSTFPANSYMATNYWVDVAFTPTPVPGQVTAVSAIEGGRTSANVSWSAPATGGAVTSYRITPYIGATAQTPTVITGNPPLTTATVTGLTTGTSYRFTVTALNPNGAGPASAQSNAVMPTSAVPPATPTAVTARAASEAAQVTWSAPAADGDSPITGYRVTPYVGGVAQTPTDVGADARTATVNGLFNGTSYTFRVAARNAVGVGTPSAPTSAVVPQATIFDFQAPAEPDVGDRDPVEVGLKFRADHDGTVTGIRFYKSALNGGTHVGTLWSTSGDVLRRVSFSGESATGWQTATFDTPLSVTAGTTYVASYFAPQGHYAATSRGLENGADNPPLHALADSESVNGVYAYASSPTFPNRTYRAANYWVDVNYSVPKPGPVAAVSAQVAGQRSAQVSWTAPSSGGPVRSYRVTPYVGSAAQTPRTFNAPAGSGTVTGLTTGTTYRFTVEAVNASGSGPASAQSNAVTPQGAVAPTPPTDVVARPATRSALVTWTRSSGDGDSPITGQTITPYIGGAAQTPIQVGGATTSATISGLTNGSSYTFRVTATNAAGTSAPSAASMAVVPRMTLFDFPTPGVVDSGEGDAIQVGVKFRSDTPGRVTGIRFYKAGANTGTHVGSLWTAGGERVRQATFTSETASGWQSVTFSSPYEIQEDTTYIAAYHAPRGHYSVTSGGLMSGVERPPLQALASSTSPNGVFAYGGPDAFPVQMYGSANYWVDVMFDDSPAAGATAPAAPTAVQAEADSTAANVRWTAPASNGGSPVTAYTVTPYVGTTAGTPATVPGSATRARITGLGNGTAYTFRVVATNAIGTSSASTASAAVTPRHSLLGLGVPETLDAGDDSAVNLGVKFTPTVDGAVTGIRFYKAARNTGTHVGTLWDAAGGRLREGTFANESATGWQTLTFTSPQAVTAGTTYVASYFAPAGHYSVTAAAFASGPVENPPLRGLANSVSQNGVYAYASGVTYPTGSYNATNYWVDVLFAPGA